MSQRSKVRHARRDAQEEKQAKKVVTWIFVVLIVLALVFIGAAMVM